MECDGGLYCMATRHVHGCFADKGDCDDPKEHQSEAAGLATYVCAWCGGEDATLWLCSACDRTPWSKGGARYVLRRRYQEAGGHSRYVLRVVDRAYLYTALSYDGSSPHAYLRDLNHAASC